MAGKLGRPALGADHYLKIDARTDPERHVEIAIAWLKKNGYQIAANDKNQALSERRRESTLTDDARASLRVVPERPIRLSSEPVLARPSQGQHIQHGQSDDARAYLDGGSRSTSDKPRLDMLGLTWVPIAKSGSIPINRLRINADGISFSKLFEKQLGAFIRIGTAKYQGVKALAFRFSDDEQNGSVKRNAVRPAYLGVQLAKQLSALGFERGFYQLVECQDGWLAIKA